jgi:hypothetical protein
MVRWLHDSYLRSANNASLLISLIQRLLDGNKFLF